MLELIIQGGDVVTPHGVAKCDVGIAGERIAAIAAPGALPTQSARRVIEAAGRIVMPGGIDPHVHLKHVWIKPDGTPLVTAGPEQVGRAALHGGTTTLIDFAYWREGGSALQAIESRKSLDARAWLADEPHSHSHVHDRHDAEITTYALVREQPIRALALTLFLEALAEHCGADLLRLKGIVQVAECTDRPAVLHGVQHVFHAPVWLDRWPSDDRRSRIVFITRRIPRSWVEALLDALEAEVEEVCSG